MVLCAGSWAFLLLPTLAGASIKLPVLDEDSRPKHPTYIEALIGDDKRKVPHGRSRFFVQQKWAQPWDATSVVHSRKVHCLAVPGNGPLRPIIYLHSLGANGSSLIFNHMMRPLHGAGSLVVSPDGYMNSWDAVAEKSFSDDIEFVHLIIDRLVHFSNVDVSDGVTVAGFSNGCGLVQRIAVESRNPLIKRLGCLGTSLNRAFYRDGNFYSRSDNYYRPPTPPYVYGFKNLTMPLQGRILWEFRGKLDATIPYAGGPALGDSLLFYPANESVQAWANHYGHGHPGEKTRLECEGYTVDSYLKGQVVLLSWVEVGHALNSINQARHHLKALNLLSSPEHPRCAATTTPEFARPAEPVIIGDLFGDSGVLFMR